MADTFDRLMARIPRHPAPRVPPRGEIRIRFHHARMNGVIPSCLLDDRDRLPLPIGEELTIKVAPGEHRLSLQGFSGILATANFRVEVGKRVDLIFSSPAEWNAFDRLANRVVLGLSYICLACFGLGFILDLPLGWAMQGALDRLQLTGPIAKFLREIVQQRLGPGMFFVFALCLPLAASVLIWWRLEARHIRAEVGPGYSLQIVGTESIGVDDAPSNTAAPGDWYLE